MRAMTVSKLTHQLINLTALNFESVKIVNTMRSLKCSQAEEHQSNCEHISSCSGIGEFDVSVRKVREFLWSQITMILEADDKLSILID